MPGDYMADCIEWDKRLVREWVQKLESDHLNCKNKKIDKLIDECACYLKVVNKYVENSGLRLKELVFVDLSSVGVPKFSNLIKEIASENKTNKDSIKLVDRIVLLKHDSNDEVLIGVECKKFKSKKHLTVEDIIKNDIDEIATKLECFLSSKLISKVKKNLLDRDYNYLVKKKCIVHIIIESSEIENPQEVRKKIKMWAEELEYKLNNKLAQIRHSIRCSSEFLDDEGRPKIVFYVDVNSPRIEVT
ncbi:MAG: hypothetical protein QXR78_06390 [Nitrososphaerota archaeon]